MMLFIKKIMAKCNDNAKDLPPPVMTGNYAVDALALCKHWKLTDVQIGEWMTMPSVFSHSIHSACLSTTIIKAVKTNKQHKALLTAMAIGLLNYLFSTLEQLSDEEAMLVLNQMHTENDKFVKARTTPKTEQA